MMKKRLGRAVSLLLCLSMLLGMIAPAAATADAEDTVDLEAGLSEDQAAPQDDPDGEDTVDLEAGLSEDQAAPQDDPDGEDAGDLEADLSEDQAAPQAEEGEYEIYPTPQSITYNGTGTVTLPATMQVIYNGDIDEYTKDRADEAFAVASVTLSESDTTPVKLTVSIGDTGNNSKYDAYKLTIDASGVTVVGKDTDAAFYGLTTVKRILQQVENRQVRHLTVTDYADVPFRGFIEGYYGNPWTKDDRVALMEFGGEFKMNIYFYAPKDDPKHSEKWRELYTDEELETLIKPLAEAGNASKCYFGFALHPFWADTINYADEASYAKGLADLKAKYEQVMSVGVRQIAVLADDRGLPSVGAERSYVRLLTDLTEWVSSDEMQTAYPGLKTTIPFCPNDYMGNASSDQVQTLKKLPASVPIIQTGGAIWGNVSHSYLTTYRQNMGSTGVFMWVNWPCSDQSKGSLIMGNHDVVLYNDLTQDDLNTLRGVMVNPMQQSEPSKAGIFQVADYTWNVWNGDDHEARKKNVWNDCFKYIDHNSAEETAESAALRELSKHMICNNGSGWRTDWHESFELSPKLTAFRAKLAAGTLTPADVATMREEFETLNNAANLYKNKETGNLRILGQHDGDGYLNNQEQMAPWLDCWVDFTQANLDLLDALAKILDNGDGSKDSDIVAKYLSGQSSLTASQGHKFWYVDHYETAIAGGEHIVPFTNDLLAAVAEEARTIIDPSILTETIITSRSDTPAGGLDAMRDGDTATEAVFKSPNSIAVGDYVGVRYNRPIDLTSVRFEVGTKSNTNDTFNDSKLQYMNESGQWVDIPGATFTHTDLVLEATGLNLTAKGVRAIATSARTGTWFGIKEIYINGQSGGDDTGSTEPGGKLSGTVIKPSTWTVWSGPESKLFDDDDSTLVWYQISGNKSVVGDYIGLDLGSVQKIGRVHFVVGAGDGDKWTDYRLEYSADNTNWTTVKTYSSSANKDVVDEDLGGVNARYVRMVNTVEVGTWTKFTEIGVWSYASDNDADKIAYQSETVGKITNPVGELEDDSATLSADLVVLKPNEFVGIALPRIRAITEIVADYSTVPNGAIVLEVGMSEDEMKVVNLASRTAYTGNARYIRLRNASDKAVSFELKELSVESDEITGIRYDESKTNMGLDANYGYQDTRENLAFFDGDIGTSTVLAHAQDAGLYVTYDLGQLRSIRKLVMAMNESEKNYLRHGVLEVSPTGEDGSWITVVTVDNDGAAESEVKDGAKEAPSFRQGVPQQNYVSFVGEVQGEAVNARYLRIRVTAEGSKFISAVEILINSESFNSMEYVRTSNDPTFEANPIEGSADFVPANMRDGDLTTAFRPNMDGKTEGSVIYRLSDETSIGQINVVADAAMADKVTVSIRKVGEENKENFTVLGKLSGGFSQFKIDEDVTGVAEIKLSWGDTTPTIYELITVARDKVEEGGQVPSVSETVPINSYSGSDCSILFDENWKFNLGDASGAQAKVYNDSTWRTVNLPHDFSIEGEYTSAGEAESGYLLGGTGWYRKSFTVAGDWDSKTVTIDFGGAYMDTEVYLNGEKLGEHHYGYTPFSFVLPGDLLDYSGENVIAVKVVNTVPSSRWYSGSGIYRSVYLTVSEPVHVARYGTYVNPVKGTGDSWTVNVKTAVENNSSAAASVTVKQEIFELDGTTFEKKGAAVAENTSAAASVAANGTQTVDQSLSVSSPKLWNSWDKGTPNLYVLVTTVKQGDTVLDTYETEFGFRTIAWDADTGFKLNGVNLKLKGVCQHHDQGALGAEAWYRALERQVDILMDMGVNSIRVTHNPAADELIEICNRKGVLVIDELFDGWAHPKNGNSGDFSRWFNQTLGADSGLVGGSANMKWQQFVAETVVNRDKNAPCVIMYSLCNEVQEGCAQGTDFSSYPAYARELIGWIQAIDNTRYVTRGDNTRTASNTGVQGEINQAIHDAGGVVGFNYYGGSTNPILPGHNRGWLMYAAETVSHINSRGVYDRKDNGSDGGKGDGLLTAYDKSAVGWGTVASDGWWRTIQYDYSAGEYIWTGFDYLGEPTPYNGTGSGKSDYWSGPFDLAAKSSYFGAIDTNGLPKDNYWLYRSMWNDNSHTLHILPTWDESDIIIENGKVEVVVYTDAPMVKLYLNNQEVGSATSTTHTTDAGHVYRTFDNGTGAFVKNTGHQSLYATFNVTYAEGTLRAVACNASGEPLSWVTEGRSEVRTTSGASRLVVEADRATIKNDGRDLSYVTISVVDANGNIVNGAKNEITVSVSGDGVFMGLDNGVQPDHTSFLSRTRQAGAGQLVAIVQSTKTEGKFTVTATADGLISGSVEVRTSGAASTVSPETPVSYDISKTFYVQRGVEPDLPTTTEVTLGSGTKVSKSVTWADWDKSLLNTVGSEFTITGTIADYNISVSVSVVVLDNVAALLNYSTAVRVGQTPTLPAARPAIMADGTVLSAQFPVTWAMPDASAYGKEGTVEITGTATVFDKPFTVTAWVRVAAEGAIVGGSLSGDVIKRPTVGDGTNDEANNDLLKAYDGDLNTVWTGSGATNVEFDTAQNLYRIKLTYKGSVPATSDVTITLARGVDTVSVRPTVDNTNKTATYELGGIHSSENVTITFANEVTLAEVELITATPIFDVYDTAELDGLKFNGENASAEELRTRTAKTPLLIPTIVPVSAKNVACTILPDDNGKVIIVTESENQASRDMYTVYLGKEDYDDGSRDYPYNKTTAYAPSAENGTSDGPASWAVDGDESTFWHSAYDSNPGTGSTDLTNKPEERYIQLTLEETTKLVALRYKPRPSIANGIVTKYRVEVSTDGTNFTPVATGDWAHDTEWKVAEFEAVAAKYVRLYGVETRGSDRDTPNKFMSCAELRVVVEDTRKDLSLAVVTVDPPEQHWRNTLLRADEVIVSYLGEVLTENVHYTLSYENNRDPGTAYVLAIATEGSGYKGSASGTFLIKKSDATISSLEARVIWVQEGIEPELPDTVWAIMSDGHRQAQDVTWTVTNNDYYMNPAQYTILGTVDGTALQARLTVNVAAAQSVDGVSAVTLVGTEPTLPSTVTVRFDDGTSRECGVTWKLDGKNWNTADTVVEVEGELENIDPSRCKATANVRVAESSGTTYVPDTTNIALNTNSGSRIFPFALAYWSSGNNNPYQAIKGQTTGSANAADRWSDWERNTYHTGDNRAWMGVAFETSTSGVAVGQNQTLTLVPHKVNQVKVMFVDENGTGGSVTFPDSYTIQYYTGPVTNLTFDTRLTVEDDAMVGNGRVRGWTDSPLNTASNWSDVTVTGTQPAVPSSNGQMLTVDFEPVDTAIIRVLCTPKSNKWSGIQALEVYEAKEVIAPPVAHNDFTVTSITLDSEEKLSAFGTGKVLEVELDEYDSIPLLAVTVDNNASVSIVQASQVPGAAKAGAAWATATITSEDGSKTETYTVKFTRKGHEPGVRDIVMAVDENVDKITLTGEGVTWDAEHSAYKVNDDTEVTINVTEGYELADLSIMIERCYHADGDSHAGTGVDVENGKFTVSMGDLIFNARVIPVTYTITYVLNGGEVEYPNPVQYDVETPTITLRNPTRTGYEFVGWTEAGSLEPAAKTVTIAKGSTGNRTYTAVWAPRTYTISYVLDGGTVSPANPTSYKPTDDAITLNNPTRSGYTFLGWTGTGITSPTTTVTIAKGSTGNRIYTAHWEDNGGGSQTTNPGTVLPLDPTPSKPDDDTTTTVEKNDDGSTTTTVTDNKTGVVTATTEKTDGSTVVKVIEANEDVTITVTDADGEVLAEVEIPAEIPEPATRFVDVPEGHWADEAIHSIAALKIVEGVGNNTFNRDGDMKRGDLALVLSRMSSTADKSYELTFADVPATMYYANGVAWAAKAGVVMGRSEETFDPENTITREELALMLYRYAKLVGMDTSASSVELDAFTDGSNTHSWAVDGMAWCVKSGILQGKGGGILDPRTNVTRAEVAMMLKRFINLMK